MVYSLDEKDYLHFLLERMSAMKKTPRIALLLALTLLASLLVACTQEPPPMPIPRAPETPLSPAPEIPVDPTDYEKLLDDAFAEAKTLSAEELEYEVVDAKVTIKGYKGTEKAIAIPEKIDDHPVTAIAESAFADNTALEVLVLPSSISTMGQSILKGCTALRALRSPLLGERITKNSHLGYLFGSATYADNARDVPASLKLLEINGNFDSIHDFAFFECNDLVAVRLADRIVSLGKYAFYGCFSMKYLTVDRLKQLGDHALDSCAAFVSLEFTDSLTEIGLGALQGCTDLRRLTLPFVGGSATENTYLGYVFGAEYPDFAKGYYPGRFQEITVLEGCISLGDYAFFECETLRKVTLPEGIRSIGVRAFDDCDSLSQILLPASLETIRENAFMDCDYLASVIFNGENLEEIGVNAFYNCLSLGEIKLPASLKSLPGSCFANCVSLESITMEGVMSVEKNAFHNCVALKSVTAPDGIKYEKGNDAAEALNKKK